MSGWVNIEYDDLCLNREILTAIGTDQSCTVFPLTKSEVKGMIILPLSTSVVWTNSTSLCGAIDNNVVGAGKYIPGIGSVSQTQLTESVRSRQVNTLTDYLLNFRVTNLGKKTRDLLIQLQCHPRKMKIYYLTVGDRLFGGTEGLRASYFSSQLPLETGGVEYGNIKMRWFGHCGVQSALVPGITDCLNQTTTKKSWVTESGEDWPTESDEYWEWF